MENAIRILITISVVIAALLALVVLAVLIHYLRTRHMARRLLKRGTRGRDFVYDLLKTSFPAGRLFKNARIPYRLSDGTERLVPCDLILVDRGGVFVIRIRHFSGAIDNTDRQVWTVRNHKGIAEIPNPVEQNRNGTRAVDAMLKQNKILNVPVHNLVVFTGRQVRFRMCTDHVMTAEHLLDTVRDLNRNKFLSQVEMAATVSTLRRTSPRTQNRMSTDDNATNP
jgi:hypothetical protein